VRAEESRPPANGGRGKETKVKRRLSGPSSGMTLMELMVVIAIIGILAALLLPAVSRVRRRARLVECKNNLAEIGMALRIYGDAHSEYFPLWPQWGVPEFTERDGRQYLLDATNVLQWGSADPAGAGVNEKIALGVLFPEFLSDARVFDEPGSGETFPDGVLIDERSNSGQDLTVKGGYYFVNGDFEITTTKGPLGTRWKGYHSSEPVVWCAQHAGVPGERDRFAHRRQEINCLYLDGHVATIQAPDGQPDDFIVRPAVPWDLHDVLRTIKTVTGTYNQEYPP